MGGAWDGLLTLLAPAARRRRPARLLSSESAGRDYLRLPRLPYRMSCDPPSERRGPGSAGCFP
ncbi:hypothetical protein GCM10010236_29420 [Streptomyces eurythermus]|nr:hypothetical protein GCM10010236_29420 [Streptomyces eurythermus]